MKKELDPKIAGIVIAVIVIVVGGIFFFKTRTPADRSGPQFTVDFSKKSMTPRKGLMPPGWKPGSVQGSGKPANAPGEPAKG